MLISVQFYIDRYGTADAGQVESFIRDVSAEVVDYVETLDSTIDTAGWDETTTPSAIQATIARVVNRAIGNPMGISQEGLGDHQRSFTLGAAGGMLSPKDRRIVRRAAGASATGSVPMEGYLPLEHDLMLDNDLL